MAKEKGKAIDKWTVLADGQDVKCELRMVKGEVSRYGTREPDWFFAVCPSLGIQVSENDGPAPQAGQPRAKLDTAQLRKELEKRVKAAVATEWLPYLVVSTKGSVRGLPAWNQRNVYGVDVADLTLEVRCVQLAETPQGKRHRWSEPASPGSREHVCDGWPTQGLDLSNLTRYRDPADAPVLALLPDTPENRAALEGVVQGFAQLRARLQDLLGPDRAQATLAQIAASGGSLLALGPAAPPPKKGKTGA